MFDFQFIRRYKQKRNVRKLVEQGILTPVASFEQYTSMVKEAKANAEHRLFTNCYMLPDEIKRLIALKRFYSVKTDNGLAFVDDEGGYYYMFLYVDLEKELALPQLDRNTLLETVFYKDRKTTAQENFEALIKTAGYTFLNTYISIADRPQIPPDKYWKRMAAVEKNLTAEGKRIDVPSYKQLRAFEKIYRQEIDQYVQKRYTRRERKRQADQQLLHCVTDNKKEIYAIRVSSILHGGAIASRSDCRDSIYAPALLMYAFKPFYQNLPENLEDRKSVV